MDPKERLLEHELIEAKVALLHSLADHCNHYCQVLQLEHKIIDLEADLEEMKGDKGRR